ncbi:BTB/POZ domain-containing protein KCTD7-like [Mercenaria mercenaria]|uniref:BTB/POZ domain-containing protein KCTD7-like n=1 Tax=Mercenaria mercenaria TaxID=6596 RepID=UPI00234E4AFB|nr:BTB/POZ domain-containing protein KCTD7-like [Mercenaria mercenaria]
MEKDYENDCVIELNVGGTLMNTLRSTVTKEADSLLANMIKGNVPLTKDGTGRYFLDRDPVIFGHVLEFLRSGLHPPHNKVIHVYEYAKYFGITKLVDLMEQFQTVQYKKRADEAKSKLDPVKYDKLKQNIICKLAGLSRFRDKCVCIQTCVNSANTIPGCTCESWKIIGVRKQQLAGTKTYTHAYTSKPPIPTELPITDDNLLIAIREDLYQLGFGKLRYYRGQENCKCHFHSEYLYILLSKRHEDKLIDFQTQWENI